MWNMWLYYTIQGDEITLHNSVYNCDSLVSIWRVFICSKMKPIVWPLMTSRCCWRACILTFASSSCACSSAFSADSVSLAWNGTVRTHKCKYNTHVQTHTCTHTRAHPYTYTHTYVHTHTRAHTHMYARAHPYTYTHTYVHTHVHTHMYARTHTCMHVHIHTRTHIHRCKYTHTHTHLFCSC